MPSAVSESERVHLHRISAFRRAQPQHIQEPLRSQLAAWIQLNPPPTRNSFPPEWLDQATTRKSALQQATSILARLSGSGPPTPSRSRPSTATQATPQAPQAQRPDHDDRDDLTSIDDEIPRQSGKATMADNFSEAQFQALQQLVADAIQTAMSQQRRGSEEASMPEAHATTTRAPNWRDDEVGFFWPDLDLEGDGDTVTTTSGQVMMRDVHLFIDRLKDAAAYRNDDLVKERIPALLRGSAQQWYTTGLDDLTKRGLRHSSLETWYETLANQFKRPLSESLSALQRSRYTLNDARNRRPIAAYVYTVVRHARDSGHDRAYQQATYAYNGIDVQLRDSVPPPSYDVQLASFVQSLEQRRDNWAQIADRCLRTRGNYTSTPWSGEQARYSYRQFDRMPTADGFIRSDIRPQFYPNNPRYPPSNRVPPSRLPLNPAPSSSRLAITAAGEQPRNGTTRYNDGRFGKPGYATRPFPPLRPFTLKANHTDATEAEGYYGEGESYDEEEEALEEPYLANEDGFTTQEHAYNAEMMTQENELSTTTEACYIDAKAADKRTTSSQLVCYSCGKSFPSRNQLHRHINDEHPSNSRDPKSRLPDPSS